MNSLALLAYYSNLSEQRREKEERKRLMDEESRQNRWGYEDALEGSHNTFSWMGRGAKLGSQAGGPWGALIGGALGTVAGGVMEARERRRIQGRYGKKKDSWMSSFGKSIGRAPTQGEALDLASAGAGMKFNAGVTESGPKQFAQSELARRHGEDLTNQRNVVNMYANYGNPDATEGKSDARLYDEAMSTQKVGDNSYQQGMQERGYVWDSAQGMWVKK